MVGRRSRVPWVTVDGSRRIRPLSRLATWRVRVAIGTSPSVRQWSDTARVTSPASRSGRRPRTILGAPRASPRRGSPHELTWNIGTMGDDVRLVVVQRRRRSHATHRGYNGVRSSEWVVTTPYGRRPSHPSAECHRRYMKIRTAPRIVLVITKSIHYL